MRFDLADLRLFLAVAEAGSITHGAAEAGLSLPAASERLRDMETDGAVQLLVRGRRGIQLTQAGDALAHHARLILRQMSQMRGELAEHAARLRTSVRLTANTVAITEFLPERLGPWMAAHPRTDIDLKERPSAEIARLVSAGFAELGILNGAEDVSGLELRPFAIDRLVLILPPGHPLANAQTGQKGARISFAQLLDEHFIGLAGGAMQEHVEQRAARLGAQLKLRLRLQTFESICRMVADGAGLAIVPETAARRWMRPFSAPNDVAPAPICAPLPAPKLEMMRLSDSWSMRQLVLCCRADEPLSPPATALLEHLAVPDFADDMTAGAADKPQKKGQPREGLA